MNEIKRHGMNDECAWSEIVEAGDFVFLNFCTGSLGTDVETQVNGTLDEMSKRLEKVGLTLDSVVKIDVLMKDPWNIPIMEKVFQQRFKGKYPARKTIATNFAEKGGENGRHIQIDAIAYRK